MSYMATPCPCGHRACRDWHVSGVANVQGVHFTKEQAEAVAALLNLTSKLERDLSECRMALDRSVVL